MPRRIPIPTADLATRHLDANQTGTAALEIRHLVWLCSRMPSKISGRTMQKDGEAFVGAICGFCTEETWPLCGYDRAEKEEMVGVPYPG